METLKQMKFSDRIGITSPNQFIQNESMNEPLRNHLWNALNIFYWNQTNSKYMRHKDIYGREHVSNITHLLEVIWNSYFNYRLDQMSDIIEYNIKTISKYFFECEWYDVYNFIEFIAEIDTDDEKRNAFINFCNDTLVNDSAGYRFVDGRIMPITTEIEIESIEKVRRLPDKFYGVKKHIDQAQALFSKRPEPDYRNSIKESISAVEALCSIVSENEHASLGQAIDIMRKKDFPMHSAFITALDRLYGYTSNADGIRHSLLDKDNLTSADAKFMLVICSAFVNYIIEIVGRN